MCEVYSKCTLVPMHALNLSDECSLVGSSGRSIIKLGKVENILRSNDNSGFCFSVVWSDCSRQLFFLSDWFNNAKLRGSHILWGMKAVTLYVFLQNNRNNKQNPMVTMQVPCFHLCSLFTTYCTPHKSNNKMKCLCIGWPVNQDGRQ